MKTRILSLLGLAALLAFAPIVSAETLKLKFAQLAELSTALGALDGSQRVVDQGEGKPAAVVFVAYDLGGKTRLAIARNGAALKAPLAAFEETRQALLKQVSPGAPEKVAADPDLVAKFVALWAEAIKDPVAVDLTKLTEEELRLDANAVPPSILTALLPILK